MFTNQSQGWRRVKLGEILTVSSGTGLNVRQLDGGDYPVYGGNGITGYHSSYLLEEPRLIIGRVGAKCGVTHITKPRSWVTDNALIVEPKTVDFDLKFFQYKLAYENLNKLSVSTAQPVISGSKIYAYEVLLPPLNAQRLIVSKIEELFSELDKGIEQLKTAQQQLQVYRQAVLKCAFEGKFTSEKVKGCELPEGWTWAKLSDLGDWKGGGTPSKSRKDFWQGGNILWVSPKDMKSKTIYDTIDKITLDAIENSSAKLIKQGSILFVVRSGILRRTLPVAITVCDVTVNQDLQAFTPKEISPDYVYWYIISQNDQIRTKCSKDGTTVESIESSLLKSYPIPICSKPEQQKLIQEIERRLSVCEKLEETITSSLHQAAALRQSILKKAFEGQLLSETEAEIEKIQALSYSIPEEQMLKVAEPKTRYKKKLNQAQAQFPKIIDGIKTTDLHAGILAMVIDTHEKSSKHHMKLSHVKGEKIAHLVEAHIGIDLGRVPKKDAAGPDDFPHLKKVESRAAKAGWFGVKKLRVGQTYVSKSGMPKIIKKVKEILPGEYLNRIEQLIQTFLPFELEHAEVIATLYAGWNNLLLEGKNPTDEDIVYESRENWSERKLGIERQSFFKALKWMKEHGYRPLGIGKVVRKAKAKSKKGAKL